MKTVRAKKPTRFPVKRFKPAVLAAGFFSIFLLVACSPPESRELDQAMSNANKGYNTVALSGFDRVIKRAPESPSALTAAREGARIAVFELKDYKKAVVYLRHIILSSVDAAEREQAQKQLASILFEHLQDYAKAIVEYSRLLAMNPPSAERVKDQLIIARANFYQGNFGQAESEVDDLLKGRIEANSKFEAMTLKGNILVAKKRFSDAAEIYKALLKEFPERSKQENVGLQLTVCYEENQDFQKAIATLETLRGNYSPPEYIELRIKRLQERARNQPGAKGYRK